MQINLPLCVFDIALKINDVQLGRTGIFFPTESFSTMDCTELRHEKESRRKETGREKTGREKSCKKEIGLHKI